MSIAEKDLNSNLNRYAKIFSGDLDDEIENEGVILRYGSCFLMLRSAQDWHYNGVAIVPVSRINRIETSDFLDQRRDIIDWNTDVFNLYDWVCLDSYICLFESLKADGRIIFISDEEQAEVGSVFEVFNDHIVMNAIDAAGGLLDDKIVYPFDEVLDIEIDSEYALVLKKYSDYINKCE